MHGFLPLRILFSALLAFTFSIISGQIPSHWQDDSGIITFKESIEVYQNNFSCRIDVHTGTQSDCDFSNLTGIPVVAGETFKISFWYFTSEHVRLRAAFDWNTGNATYSANYAGPTTTGDWQEFVYEDVVPDGATGVNLRIRAYDVAGFTAPETQYVDLVTFESPIGNPLTVANGDFESWPSSLPEPTNYPTLFEASANEQQIELSWTDATGTQLPEAYLILAGINPSFSPPVDGEFVPDDFDFTDGTGAANIAFGVENFAFSGLNPETTYHFEIYSYTNSGQDVDYKTDGTPPAASATTGLLPPEITVFAPENGVTWFRGNTYDVLWEVINVTNDVLIEITGNASSGSPVWVEVTTVPAQPGVFSWTVPVDHPAGDDFQFRVSHLQSQAIGLSGIFSIADEPDFFEIVINEIMYNPPSALGDDDYWEYLEIFNNDTETADLSGWSFTSGIDFEFPEGTFLNSGEYLVVARDPDTISGFYGITNLIGPFAGGALSNGGEAVELSDAFGTVIDFVDYDDGGDWPSEPDGDGPSLSLIHPDLDNTLPENWETSVIIYGTPGQPNNPEEPLIQVVYPNGGEILQQGLSYDIAWNSVNLSGTVDIELINLSGGSEILAQNIDITLELWTWEIPLSQPVGDQFKVSVNSNASPSVSDESDDVFSVIAYVEVPNVVINEIMYNPPEALGLDDHWEFLELVNNDTETVDLSDWSFTEGIDFAFPTGTLLDAGEFLVIARNPDTLANFYGIANLTGPFDGGALNNAGETVELSDQNGNVADVVSYLDTAPWPDGPDGNGPSLSLIDPDLDNSLPESWQASPILYGTPGLPNNPEEPVLQVLYPNGGETLFKEMSCDITWDFIDLTGNVSIELTRLSGSTQTLATDIDITFNAWTWQIPASQETGDDFKILITSLENPDIHDESNAVFSIANMPDVPALVITEIMYNPPEIGSDSLEFIEIYNNDVVEVNLEGFTFGSGIDFEFPSIILNSGAYLLVAVDSTAMINTFAAEAWQWSGGALSNGGELLELLDNFGNVVDFVDYNDQFPWDTLADGNGPSLVLCNPDDDNSLGENWLASAEFAAVNAVGDSIFATPGGPCITTNTISRLPGQTFGVYPNPNRGTFWIQNKLPGDYRLEIYSLSGTLITDAKINGTESIDVSDKLAPGMYLMIAIDQNTQQKFHSKLIIEN